MTVGIYNPYHSTLGGGELYMFTFASFFLNRGDTVIYFSPTSEEVKKAEERFNLDLSAIKIRPKFSTVNLDKLFFYSDGSIPLSLARKTYIIFQFPVPWVNGGSVLAKLKQMRINDVIVNSAFTKRFIDKTFSVQSKILYPAIDSSQYSSGKKKNYILSVGRFTKGMNTKRHDILIQTFKQMVDKGLGYTLVIAGGVRDEDKDMVEAIKKQASGYPVTIMTNISQESLHVLYKEASLYWHAAGYGIDEQTNPQQVEHFGISTVEAMASGVVPLVFPAGGQKEIVTDTINGFYWRTTDDLQRLTQRLIENSTLRATLQDSAKEDAHKYDRQNFFKQLELIISE